MINNRKRVHCSHLTTPNTVVPFSDLMYTAICKLPEDKRGGIDVVDTVWKSRVVFLMSIVPLVESKGAILVARLWHLPFWLSGTLCVIGSYIPVPILLYHKQVNHVHLTKKLWTIPESIQKHIERYGCWALLVLIAIPSPAWVAGLGHSSPALPTWIKLVRLYAFSSVTYFLSFS